MLRVCLCGRDLSSNPLLCDCELGWLVEWARNVSVKLTSSPKCGAPPSLRGQPMRKLRMDMDFICNASGHNVGALLELKPAHSQVSALPFTCIFSCKINCKPCGKESTKVRMTQK